MEPFAVSYLVPEAGPRFSRRARLGTDYRARNHQAIADALRRAASISPDRIAGQLAGLTDLEAAEAARLLGIIAK